jgi:hypothetical protein
MAIVLYKKIEINNINILLQYNNTNDYTSKVFHMWNGNW